MKRGGAFGDRGTKALAGLAISATACAAAIAAPSPDASDSSATRVAAGPRPNVVLIVVDDLGWKDVGGEAGMAFRFSPRIDALAREGMRFRQAYAAAPVCSPTRAALMTGMAPPRIGITDWIPGARFPKARLSPPEILDHLPLEALTLSEALRGAGYSTAHFGKWHLGGEPYWPEKQGFDLNVMGCHTGHPASYFWPYGNAIGEGHGVPARAKDDLHAVRPLPPGGAAGEYLTDRQADEVVRWLEEPARRERPFFAFVSFYAVHSPYQAPEGDIVSVVAPRPPAGKPEDRIAFAAMVVALDRAVARVLDALDRIGAASDTLVVFTSDNGGVEGISDLAPLRGFKGTLYEGGLRVPLFVRWPGVVRAGSSCDEPVITHDLFPTLIAASGGSDSSDGLPAGLDGIDLTPLLSGRLRALDRDELCWHYPHYHTAKRPPRGAIRSGSLKLIESFEDGRFELYDLARDPGESNDLSGERPRDVARLAARLGEWRESIGARMPVANPAFDERESSRAIVRPDPALGRDRCACAFEDR